jgi:putative DNA primase/helicase
MNTDSITDAYTVNNDLPEIAASEVEGIVPHELLDHQWVNWRYEWRQNNRGEWKLTKVPTTTADTHASTTSPATWEAWNKAVEHAMDNPGTRGVGWVLSADDPYFMLDLDDAYITYFDGDTLQVDIAEWAMPWVEFARAYGLYIEVSPSETGLKIIGKGTLPGTGRRHVVKNLAGEKIGEFELYDRDRFTTITGDDICPVDVVGDGQDLIDKLLADVFKPEKQVSEDWGEPNSLPDEEVIERACNKNWFRKAWNGDYSRWDKDESRGDSAVANRLSFFTRCPEQTERIMRNNQTLYRDKWDTHRTYLERTIQNSAPDDFYDPTRAQNSNNGTITSPAIIIGKHLPSYSVDELNESAREETP